MSTTIEWTDETFNPVRGCRKLSAGCKNCYAASLSKINPGVHGVWGADGTRIFSAVGWESRFYAWEKKAVKAGKPMRIFPNSMWDPGEGPDVDGKEGRNGPRPEYLPVLAKLVEIARRCPHLRLQMLTKRPWNLVAWWQSAGLGEWPANLWIGASTENQEEADERILWLLQLPAAVRFLSVEPMLGAVSLHSPSCRATGSCSYCVACLGGISWLIAGCESGRGARPMELNWVRALRDQCASAEVAFFFKQMMNGRDIVSLPELDGQHWAQFPE